MKRAEHIQHLSFAEQLAMVSGVARKQYGKEATWDLPGGAWQRMIREKSILPEEIITILEQPYGKTLNDHLTISLISCLGSNFLSISNHTDSNRTASWIIVGVDQKKTQVVASVNIRYTPDRPVAEALHAFWKIASKKPGWLADNLLDFVQRHAPDPEPRH